jgi:SAM-dependent methyltransferase
VAAVLPCRFPGLKVRTLGANDAKEPLGWSELFEDRILYTDSAHVFLITAQALADDCDLIAEVGCGRGVLVNTERGETPWQDLRGDGRKVIGIDVDPIGVENPVIDEFRLIGDDGVWPLESGSVDLAVCDFVLEHITDPPAFMAELTRTLRPGGVFIARTVSRHSFLSMAARAVPNRKHSKVLNVFQPGRQEQDVFHTAYLMNSRKQLAALFDADYDWAAASRTGLDRYFMPWPRVAGAAVAVERRLPRAMHTGLVICARKR